MHTITSEIRGGGSGNGAWVAKLIGTDAKFGFQREFVRKDAQVSRSGRSGYVHFHISEPGFYEYRGVQLSAGQASIGSLKAGFIRVGEDGTVEEVTKSEVRF